MRSLLLACVITVSSSALANARNTPLQLGADRLEEPAYLATLQGKRIAVLAHRASMSSKGESTVDLLARLPGVSLRMILSPEHGFRSAEDTPLPDSIDPVTRLPIYSLYGPRRAPTPEMLAQVDLVVADLQDVGLRYYTYPATLAYTLAACARAGVPVLVLDRPNPIGGALVEGAVLAPALVDGSPTRIAAIPTRHGMTIGEIARYLNHVLGLGARLDVVPMKGWDRANQWDELGLTWVPPSPALQTFEQALGYAILSPLEATNFSVGRGLDNRDAFRVFGAPWITPGEQASLVKELRALALPGLEFSPAEWVAERDSYQGKLCRGFRLSIAGPRQIDLFAAQVAVLELLERGFSSRLGLQKSISMLGAPWFLEALRAGAPADAVAARAASEATEFSRERAKALLYSSESRLRVLVFPHIRALTGPQGRESQLATVALTSSAECVATGADGKPTTSGRELSFSWAAVSSPLRIRCPEPVTVVREVPLRSFTYRGELVVRRSDAPGAAHLEVINEIGLEDYLEGVIAGEMPASWPAAALGAQAIAARTYALWELEHARDAGSASRAYDFDDTVQYQAYVGVPAAPQPSIAQALEATRGKILTQGDGKPIKAYFHDDSGGHTESAAVVFPAVAAPYCAAKPEIYDASAAPAPWTLTLSAEVLSAKLVQAGLAPAGARMLELSVSSRSASGRAARVLIAIEGGAAALAGASELRFALGLRSTLFEVKREGSQFVFRGRGWGHGVGMSQWGAKLLSEQKGFSSEEILRFYYSDTSIQVF